MDIPIELFITFIGSSIALALFGFLRNPQIPAMLAFGGIFILVMVVMTDNITISYDTDNLVPQEVLIREQIIQTNTLQLYNGSFNSTAQVFLANNPLIGREINTIQFILSRTGSPTGNATVGIMDATAGNFKQIFNTIDSATVNTATTQYNFTLPVGDTYTVEENDRIGIHFNSGNNLNRLNIRYYNVDYISNENFEFSSTTTWTDFPGELTYKVYGLTDTIQTTPINYQFTEFPKVIFSLLGVIFMLSGALMIFKENS